MKIPAKEINGQKKCLEISAEERRLILEFRFVADSIRDYEWKTRDIGRCVEGHKVKISELKKLRKNRPVSRDAEECRDSLDAEIFKNEIGQEVTSYAVLRFEEIIKEFEAIKAKVEEEIRKLPSYLEKAACFSVYEENDGSGLYVGGPGGAGTENLKIKYEIRRVDDNPERKRKKICTCTGFIREESV